MNELQPKQGKDVLIPVHPEGHYLESHFSAMKTLQTTLQAAYRE